MQQEDKRDFSLGILLGLCILAVWAWSLWIAPSEKNQGEVYRIIYMHVAVAFTTFFSSFLLFIFSIRGVIKKSEAPLYWAKASSEVGLIFTVLTLASGSIWGKPTWGVWWTWDARLTTVLILALLYAGYLLMYNSMAPGRQRINACSIMGILIFADVPIIYKSVNWWRTLHQPQSIMRPGGATISPEIMAPLLSSCVVTILFCLWLISQRAKNIRIKDELEMASFERMKA